MTEPKRYRKKPVVIEAMGPLNFDTVSAMAVWCGGRPSVSVKPSDPSDAAVGIDVPTLEGPLRATGGDFIIRGVQGEFYPCKPDIFAATYEEATDG